MNRKKLLLIGGGAVLLFVISFVIGYFSRSTSCSDSKCEANKNDPNKGQISDKELDKIHQGIVEVMKTDELRKNMRYYK